jgi:hypothetical protein
MRSPARLAFVLPAVLALIAACSGSGASPSSGPSGSLAPETYWLRMRTTQAIPPVNLFAIQPPLVITGDGVAVSQGPVPAIYPGPLLPNTVGRPISDRGLDLIVEAADALGLLDGQTDFTGDAPPLMGGVTGHIELTVDGKRIELTGNPDAQIVCVTAPCEPAAGSPEAFGEYWRLLLDLPSWLGAELGPEALYVPPAYALLVGPAPEPEAGLAQAPADWPLDTPIATFGGPVANGTARCGTVEGEDADTLRPTMQAANQLTPWVQDPGSSATFGLTVRPMVPGENVCREIFGP